MFLIILEYSENRGTAADYAKEHNEWLKAGLDDGVFLLAGSLKSSSGGVIIAHMSTLQEIKDRVERDPFVREDIVKADIIEVEPAVTDARLDFIDKLQGLK